MQDFMQNYTMYGDVIDVTYDYFNYVSLEWADTDLEHPNRIGGVVGDVGQHLQFVLYTCDDMREFNVTHMGGYFTDECQDNQEEVLRNSEMWYTIGDNQI